MELILNLDPDFINDYWKNEGLSFYELLEEVGKLETWTLTHDPIFQAKLKEFTEEFKDMTSTKWSTQSNEITQLMSYMTISQFAFFLHYIDISFPGLSFHYVMEARHNKNCKAGDLLLKRIKLLEEYNFLNKIFTPMRTRLIQGLIESDDD